MSIDSFREINSESSLIERTSFYLFLAFLFFLNFSIAVCNIIYASLLIISFYIFIKSNKKITLPGFYKYIILFIFFTMISTVFSTDFKNSLLDNKEIFIYLLVPVIFLILDSRKKVLVSLKVIFISAFLSSLLGIIISLRSGISLQHRLKGLTSHWMTYSGLLMVVFVFFIVFTYYETKGLKKVLNFTICTSILAAIILSLTRSVWVGIFLSLGLFTIYILSKKPFLLIVPAMMVLILLLTAPLSVKKRALSIFDMNNVTNLDRIHMLYTASEIIKDYPLTGVGPDNVKEIYSEYRHPDATKNNPHLHNNFLQITAERGVFSLLTFIGFILSVYISLYKFIRSERGLLNHISLAVIFLFTTFLTAGLFEYNFGDSEIKFILFYFLTLPFLPWIKSDYKEDHFVDT